MSRFAIISDIHANKEALETVLRDIEFMQCSQIVCLGDVVGYNASPVECLETIKSLNCPIVRGNHDEEAASDSKPDKMNPIAYSALMWTRQQLSPEQKEWLSKLRLVRSVPPFTIVHSTLDQPSLWHYIINNYDAASNFNFQFSTICFHGHTHVPKIFSNENGGATEYAPSDFCPQPGVKYFVNVGSVGQPRNGDPRACYCVFDTDQNAIYFRRLEYDIQLTCKRIVDAGLPVALAERLTQGL